MPILKMAFRNILRQKRRTVLTALSMCGGYVMAAVFIGWADGSYNGVIENFTRHMFGQIQIHRQGYLEHPSLYKMIDDPGRVGETLDGIRAVESWAPRVYSAGLASVGDRTSGVRMIGVDPTRESATTQFATKIVAGRSFTASTRSASILGRGLAAALKAKPEDEIVLVTQAADGAVADQKYTVLGILESGDENADRTALYLPLREAQDLLSLGTKVHEVVIAVHRLNQVLPTAEIISHTLGDKTLSVEPWQVFARSFYIAMKADFEGLWISLFIIVLIVAVGVLNTVLMSVLERQREYGMLKAVGTKPFQIVRLVLAEVNILAVCSILLGAALALAANSFLARHGLRVGDAFTYGGMKFQTLHAEINVRSFVIPALTVLFSASIVGFFPALKAARTNPAQSMRSH